MRDRLGPRVRSEPGWGRQAAGDLKAPTRVKQPSWGGELWLRV